jgi:type 1 glutamine amidotransferase
MNIRLALLCTLLSSFARLILGKQKVLLYSRTAGFRHASIPNALAALKALGKEYDFDTVSSEDESKFESQSWLNQFDALVFVSVSGEALTKKGEVNMMKYIENGGGYMGIHEACDALYHSPWYGRLVGAYFDYHPYLQPFTLDVATHDNPSTSFLNKTWRVLDEVYNFNSNPLKVGKTVVLTANPKSWNDPGGSIAELAHTEGVHHPIAWYEEGDLLTPPNRKVGGGMDDSASTPKNQRGTGGNGRSFYTALGHTKACWTDDTFLQHIYGALSWVLESPSIRSNNDSLPSTSPGSDYISNGTSSSDTTSTTDNSPPDPTTSSSSASILQASNGGIPSIVHQSSHLLPLLCGITLIFSTVLLI